MDYEQTRQERETNAARDSPDRQNREEAVLFIPLSDLHPFPNHPFKVREDDAMKETAESVREYGILTPAIVRPREGGGYEIISYYFRFKQSTKTASQASPVL